MLLLNQGKIAEALYFAKKLLALNPISVQTQRNTAKVFYKAQQHEEALHLLREARDFEPESYSLFLLTAANLIEIKQYEEANRYLEKARSLNDHIETRAMKAYLLAKQGNRTASREIVERLSESRNPPPPTYLAFIHAALDDIEIAFDLIEKSISEKHLDILSIRVDPRFSNLRDDVRFLEILNRIGLPE